MKEKRTCPGCARVLSGEARFCVGCGAELPPVTEAVLDEEPETEPEPAPTLSAVPVPTPAPPPVDPLPPPAVPNPGGGMVAAAAEASMPHFDRYAGAVPAPPPPASPPPPAPGSLPDVSLPGAFRRLARRSPLSAGIVGGVGAMAGVAVLGLAAGVLVRAAHGSQGCATGALAGSLQGGCVQPGSTNGVLTDWNAMLWSIQGVGVAFTAGDGGLVVRIPLGLGMVLTALVLAAAGAASVRLVPPGRLRDVFVRAAVIAVAYTTAMLLLGIAISARGDRLDVGPDDGLLLLWGLLLGFVGSLAGMFRRLFGAVLPHGPVAVVEARLGGAAGILEAGLVGTAAALALGALLGLVAAATHAGDAGNVLRTALLDVTTRPLPTSPTGTVAAIAYLVLALPTLAAWVLAYSLVIPTVTVGTPLGTTDYGLLAGDHDAWLWAAAALPLLATPAHRLRRRPPPPLGLGGGRAARRRPRRPRIRGDRLPGGGAPRRRRHAGAQRSRRRPPGGRRHRVPLRTGPPVHPRRPAAVGGGRRRGGRIPLAAHARPRGAAPAAAPLRPGATDGGRLTQPETSAGRAVTATPSRSSSSSPCSAPQARAGAKLRRWWGVTPRVRSAERCSRVL